MKTYLVGGAVRDKLLGLPLKERDFVVVGATPEDMLAQSYRQVGRDFPVFLHPKTNEEYALARTERKTGQGYTGFTCFSSPNVTLEEDLGRRDLTINAMAETTDGKIIDPYGGQQDLANKLLRHVSPAFVEDPLRVLRVARFAARFTYLNFTVAAETMTLMQNIVQAGELEHLTAERIWQETKRALAMKNPEVYFQVLRDCNALSVLFPEIDQLFGVPQPKEHHPEIDTGVHTMMVLAQASQLSRDTIIRFAALCHDLGKGTTPKNELPQHIEHEKRGADLVKQLCQRIKAPNEYKHLAVLVAKYHTLCHKAFELKPGKVLKLFERIDVFRKPQRLRQFLLACEADSKGRPGYETKPYPQVHFLEQAFDAAKKTDVKLLIDQGLTGEELGQAIRQARIAAIKQAKKCYEKNND